MLVAHDRWLLSQIDAEVWELGPQGIKVYDNFSAYENSRHQNSAGEISPQKLNANTHPLSAQPTSREEQKKLKRIQAEQRNALHRLLKPLQENYERLEKELDEKLNLQAALEKELADPQSYADKEKFTRLMETYNNCKARTEKIMDEMSILENDINEHKSAAAQMEKA